MLPNCISFSVGASNIGSASSFLSLRFSASVLLLFGDKENDYRQCNDGSDTYFYRSGDGNDEIADRSGSAIDVDTLSFTDLNAGDVTASRTGNALLVRGCESFDCLQASIADRRYV